MPKLSDTQRILLSAAAQRSDLSLYPLAHTHAKAGPRTAQAITGLIKAGLVEEREGADAATAYRSDGDLRFRLVLLPAALAAMGIELAATPEGAERASPPAAEPSRITKSATVLALLGRSTGATVPELITATGWLPHTTRAALTGLRKKGYRIVRGTRDGATCYTIEVAA